MRKTIWITGIFLAAACAGTATVGVIVTLKACAMLGVGLASGIAADSRLKFWH